MLPERATALTSCAPPIPPEPEQRSIALADWIFWQEISDEVDPFTPFRRQKLRGLHAGVQRHGGMLRHSLTGWMTRLAGSSRSRHCEKGTSKPRAWLKTFFSQWKLALQPAVEARGLEFRRDLECLARLNLQIAWCRYGLEAQTKAASTATCEAKQHWLEGQADSMARLQEMGVWAATWSAVRKLISPRKRALCPPAIMLGDDGKPSRFSSGRGQSAPARTHEGIRRELD